jgi:uncharacterized membrane protein (UPF0127 family)
MRRKPIGVIGTAALATASVLAAAAIAAVAAVMFSGLASAGTFNPPLERVDVRVGPHRLAAEVADNAQERRAGLSGRQRLGRDEGMLFVFDSPVTPAFWMKGMRFRIDILWLDGRRVVDVTRNVTPASWDADDAELRLYRPRAPVTHVLELRAGWAKRHGVRRGTSVAIDR